MLDKKIYRYTNVELLDVIRNSKADSLVEKAEIEFDKRSLTQTELENLESEYTKYKEYQEKRRNTPLTREEWLTCFFLPFYSSSSGWKTGGGFGEEEQQRFERFGFEKKAKEAAEVRKWGYIFWFVVTMSIGVIV